MVALDEMRAHNASLASLPPGQVALFTGATRGIGAATLRQLLTHLKKPKIYMVGRSSSKFADELSELRGLNAEASVEFIEADVTLLREVDRVAEIILESVDHLDIVCMSQGHLPTGGPKYTDEDIDQCMALSFYGRMLLVSKLLPLLERADRPRVLSVLAGGDEKKLFRDDLGLRENYGLFNCMDQLTSLSTLTLARMAGAHPRVAFLHAHPGLVSSDILGNALTTERPGVVGAAARFAVRSLLVPLFRGLVAITPGESGERFAFLLTSDRYASPATRREAGAGERADLDVVNGLYLLNQQGETKVNAELLRGWMSDGAVDEVWEHTMGVLQRAKRD